MMKSLFTLALPLPANSGCLIRREKPNKLFTRIRSSSGLSNFAFSRQLFGNFLHLSNSLFHSQRDLNIIPAFCPLKRCSRSFCSSSASFSLDGKASYDDPEEKEKKMTPLFAPSLYFLSCHVTHPLSQNVNLLLHTDCELSRLIHTRLRAYITRSYTDPFVKKTDRENSLLR